MSEITKDIKLSELNFFKDEIYGHIRKLDANLNLKITNSQVKLREDFETYEAKIKSLIEKNKDIIISLVSQKLKVEKITELENFKNKIDELVLTHDIRIKNSMDEISKIKLRYDKIISENLYVSGFIGNSCQFRNLSEYLSYNISEVSKLKTEKEQMKKDIKELKSRFEGLMKNMINLNDTSVQLCNKYTDNKQAELEKLIEEKAKETNQKNIENRIMISQFQEKTEKQEKKYKEEINKLMEIKKELFDFIDEKFLEYKKYNDELNNKIMNNHLDIDIHKTKIEKINDQIKDLHQNTKDISFQIRNYYFANNKVNKIEKNDKIDNIDKIDKVDKIEKKEKYKLTSPTLPKKVRIKDEINSPKNSIRVKQNRGKSAFNIKPTIEEIKASKNNTSNFTLKFKKDNSESEISISDNKNEEEANLNNKNKKDIMKNQKLYSLINENSKNKNKLNGNNKTLPTLSRNNMDENNAEEIKINSTNPNDLEEKDIDDKNKEKMRKKKSRIMDLINKEEEHKRALNNKKETFKKEDYELEQDNKACKPVTLALPDPFSYASKRNKIQKNKMQNDVMNTLINSYRAKLMYKAHSPEEKIEINNEILDIPKKISQAFGRTSYTFYFKKEQINSLNLNKNINNFISSNAKRNNKDIKSIVRDDN